MQYRHQSTHGGPLGQLAGCSSVNARDSNDEQMEGRRRASPGLGPRERKELGMERAVCPTTPPPPFGLVARFAVSNGGSIRFLARSWAVFFLT